MDSQRLSPRTSKALADPKNELWLSSVSVWELTVLCRKGRFRVSQDIATWVSHSIEELHLMEAPLTVEITLAIPTMTFIHGDPADHLLAATARVFDLTLVTADENLVKQSGIHVLAN
jgi:PIN domain nuclease of toxin-antitoxin system